MNRPIADRSILIDLVQKKMPFGKYEGRYLCDLPSYYLEWFASKGFPKGRIGICLETLFVIRTEGLHEILDELRARYGKP